MSVTRGGAFNGFNDLEQYSRSSDYIVRSAALSGGQQTHNPPNPPELEPAGGLHRGEVAELVAVWVEDTNIDVVETGNAGTTPGTLTGENELKLVAPMKSTTIDEDGSNDVDLRGSDFDDDNLVARWFAHGHAAFNDTTNGSGGGGYGSGFASKRYNFREELGQGPVLEEDDRLFERASIMTNDMANQDVRFRNYFRTFWEVRDKGEFGVYD